MFERYTESAKRALFFARYEASKLGGIAESILTARGLRTDEVRATIVTLRAESPALSTSLTITGVRELIDEIIKEIEPRPTGGLEAASPRVTGGRA